MNYDIVKNTLLEIINEAKNLPENELEMIPGTSVKVKKGKAKAFDVNAYYYFEHENNVIINDKMDYVTDVYNMLEREIKEIDDEYFMSKAYDIAIDNKENISRLEALNKSLESINLNYVKLSQSANDLRNKLSNTDLATWKDKFDKINNDISELAQNKDIISKAIVEIKTDINAKFLSSVHEQMKIIENNFKNTLRGTDVAYALNGESVLASDLEEYNALINLLRIMNSVSENEKLIAYEGVFCINEKQINEVKELFSKTNLFDKLKTKPKKLEKLNDKLINNIILELREIEEKTIKAKKKNVSALNGIKISEKYIDEYNNLLNILKVLHQANDSKWELVNVWNIAEVKSEDRRKFEDLIQNTKFFNNLNPDSKKQEENEELIKELKDYLVSLEQKLNQYKGVANIPSRKTKNDTIVLKEDEMEYNTVFDIINLLENSNNKLINVWGIANVGYENISKFKQLANATKYFGDKTPKIEENDIEINNIKDELANMIKNAKDVDDSLLASNGLVLQSDLDKYRLLEEKYKYLEAAKASDDLVLIDGVKIDSKYVSRYQEINKKLDVLNNKKVEEPIVTEQVVDNNQNEIEYEEPVVIPTDVDPLSYLEDHNIIGTAKPINNPVNDASSNDNVIDADFEIIEDKPTRRKVSIRKMGSTALNHVKKHWKVYLACGLCAAVVMLTLSQLAPILIYANSCNALAMPWASGLFNGFSSVIAKIGGIQFLNGAWLTQSGSIINLGAVASKSILATLQALGALGLIGASFVTTNKVVKDLINDKPNKLVDSKEKQNALDRIYNIFANFKSNIKNIDLNSLGKDVSSKVKDFSVNLMGAVGSKDIDLNNELVNSKIEYEANQEFIETDEVVSEIASTVKEKMKTENLTQQRIAERVAKLNLEQTEKSEAMVIDSNLNSGNNLVEDKPVITIPSDEEIIDSISNENMVLRQLDNYVEAVQSGRNAGEYRDYILEKTGIDSYDYNIEDADELVRLRNYVLRQGSMEKEELAIELAMKAKTLQNIVDEGLMPNLEKEKLEWDIRLLNLGIESLRKIERGL